MRTICFFLVLSVLFTFPAYCIEMQNMEDLVTDPLGDGGLVPGMSKDRVVDMYGDPDMKRDVTSGEWKEPREEWFYAARYGVIPVNAGYLSDDLYLYFDGRNLTNISKKPLGKGLTDIRGVKGDKGIIE